VVLVLWYYWYCGAAGIVVLSPWCWYCGAEPVVLSPWCWYCGADPVVLVLWCWYCGIVVEEGHQAMGRCVCVCSFTCGGIHRNQRNAARIPPHFKPSLHYSHSLFKQANA
jgi:hypothetical protein